MQVIELNLLYSRVQFEWGGIKVSMVQGNNARIPVF